MDRALRTRPTPPAEALAGLHGTASQFKLIEHSHQRCEALGLSRIERPDHVPLGRSDMTVARERNQRLFGHAAPVMEMLFEQIAGTESMIVLTDAQGTILHSVGDDDFLDRAGKVALKPGVSWAEHSKGTNAIGTALFEEAPTLVHAGQHFMHANNFLTCSAAPIFDPRGNMLGVLDVSGDQHSYHQHTMGLVRVSARMIENHWLSDDCSHRLRLHFHSRAEFIGTLLEGILVIGPEGRIVGSNRSALDQLGQTAAALRMHSLNSLLGTSVAAVMDHLRAPQHVPLMLHLPNGQPLYVTARFNAMPRPVFSEPRVEAAARPPESPAAPPAPRAAPGGAGPGQGGGLSELQTGDVHVEALVDTVRRVLDRDIPTLMMGETGTGKEMLARAIHHDSRRAAHPFVVVNGAASAETLVEAIVQANGGTLLLDEIGAMPAPQQALLLRVLQEGKLRLPGGPRRVAVDVAVICTTQRPLRECVAARQFREDLYYRLNGLSVRLPALRERSDLAAIAQLLLRRECPHGAPEIAAPALALLNRCAWPGNVRQLANVLRVAAAMAGSEGPITEAHLPDDFLDELGRGADVAAGPALPTPDTTPRARTLKDAEREAIREAVEAANGNISVASRRLGICRNTIYRKLVWNANR
jgi:transcriptional regulator of acetoin/glycerol metabolism